MDPVTTPFERALHLLLFVSGAAGIGLAAIGLLERTSDGARRTIRLVHVAIAGMSFAVFFAAERLYHAMH